MSARTQALFCLATAIVTFAETPAQPTRVSRVVVYLGSAADQKPEPIRYLKDEISPLMDSAGYSLEWRDLRGPREGEAQILIVAQLQGACDARSAAEDRL